MKRDSKAKLKANVKIYLIPKDEYEEVNGKPVLDDRYLVFDNKKKKVESP